MAVGVLKGAVESDVVLPHRLTEMLLGGRLALMIRMRARRFLRRAPPQPSCGRIVVFLGGR